MVQALHNHILIAVNLKCTTGVWVGETISYGWRVEADRKDVNTGSHDLVTFNAETAGGTSTVTLDGVSFSQVKAWVGVDGGAGQPPVTQADIEFFASTAVHFLQQLGSRWGNIYQVDSIKVSAVNSAGKSPLGPNIFTPTTPPLTGTGSSILTPETAMVVSLYTAERSKKGRGRFYFGPIVTSMLTVEGLWQTALISSVQTETLAAFNAIRARGTVGTTRTYSPVVWSRLVKTTGSTINRIRIGDEPDTHETRTKKRPELYTSASLT